MFRQLTSDQRGATTVETAFALPILILFIYGLFVVATMFQANAGMQHALGEGARYANLYPTPSNLSIATRMNDKVFGRATGTFSAAVSDGPSGGATYKTLTVTYSMPVNFIFFSSPNLSLTRTKKVYTAA